MSGRNFAIGDDSCGRLDPLQAARSDADSVGVPGLSRNGICEDGGSYSVFDTDEDEHQVHLCPYGTEYVFASIQTYASPPTALYQPSASSSSPPCVPPVPAV